MEFLRQRTTPHKPPENFRTILFRFNNFFTTTNDNRLQSWVSVRHIRDDVIAIGRRLLFKRQCSGFIEV